MKTLSIIFRRLKKSNTATIAGFAGLIAGLVCVLFIFLWINDEMNYDRFHEKTDRIFVVHAYLEGGEKKVDFRGCPPAVAPALQAEFPEIETTSRYLPAYFKSLITAKGQKNKLDVAFSDHSFFDIFSFSFIYGNQGEPNVPGQVVLTKTTALRYFGNANPVGQIVKFNNDANLTVAGVIDDMPGNSSLQFEALVPIENLKPMFGNNDKYLSTWYNNAFVTYGLLTSPENFTKIASSITNRIQKEIPESTNYLRAYLFKNGYLYGQNHIRNVKIFALIALLVLIASIFNFINLITAQSTKQTKENSLRKSIGATRGNIVGLIYSNVAVICFIAFGLALIITRAGLPYFNQIIEKHIHFSAIFAGIPILTLIGLFVLTTFLAGSYPAFFLSSKTITSTQHSNFKSVKSKNTFRNLLLVSIFAVSIILLASTLIINKQTRFLQNMEIGYNKDQLLYINLDGQLKEKYKTLKEEIGRNSGVSSATVASYLPVVVGNNSEDWDWEGKDVNFKPLITDWQTDGDLIQTLEAKMLEGHFFDSEDYKSIVINKALADAIGWNSFTGKKLTRYDDEYTIAGVIDNIQFNSVSESCQPMVINPAGSWNANYLIVKTDAKQLDATIKYISGVCKNIEPNYPVSYGFVSDKFAQLYDSETQLKKLVGIFTVFSIIVLCLGLLGVIMFLAEQKTKEIGIRRCLGEEESSIVGHLLKPFLISGIIAGIISVPVTWYVMSHWLQNYSNHIHINIWIFLGVIACSLLFALITVSWQSWRAATRNPVEALRYE